MSDKPEDPQSNKDILQGKKIMDVLKKIHNEPQRPNVHKGDKIHVGRYYNARVGSIINESSPKVMVIFLEKITEGNPMKRPAEWMGSHWEFLEGDIAQPAGSGYSDLIQELWANRFK
jgi:hypothetical protein